MRLLLDFRSSDYFQLGLPYFWVLYRGRHWLECLLALKVMGELPLEVDRNGPRTWLYGAMQFVEIRGKSFHLAAWKWALICLLLENGLTLFHQILFHPAVEDLGDFGSSIFVAWNVKFAGLLRLGFLPDERTFIPSWEVVLSAFVTKLGIRSFYLYLLSSLDPFLWGRSNHFEVIIAQADLFLLLACLHRSLVVECLVLMVYIGGRFLKGGREENIRDLCFLF